MTDKYRIVELEVENKRLMDAIDQDEIDFIRLEKQLEKCKEQRDSWLARYYGVTEYVGYFEDLEKMNRELEDIK